MRKIILFLAGLILSFLIVGCARPPVMLDRVLVHNATSGKITDVQVRHEPTNRFGGVSAILPGKALDIGFAGQPMQAKKGVVSWQDGEGQLKEIVLELPYDRAAAEQGRSKSLVYTISASGVASVSLQ